MNFKLPELAPQTTSVEDARIENSVHAMLRELETSVQEFPTLVDTMCRSTEQILEDFLTITPVSEQTALHLQREIHDTIECILAKY
ncbi:MAG: hypothetical protein KC680_00725 [Candidatus Peregrinibacteria bacterium]|nr:hypothetical protein [Candidatus Peregrinibacteria bacterium]MCB9807747.1 hypothetical protein [Candidatus Peribacteria bacterium]